MEERKEGTESGRQGERREIRRHGRTESGGRKVPPILRMAEEDFMEPQSMKKMTMPSCE